MTESFGTRLMAAMQDMENPAKTKVANVPTKSGKSFQYRYETLDQVLAIIRPALTAHGLAMTQQQTWSDHTSSYILRTVVFDDENERVMDERPIHDCADAQAAGSWETYMRRYALRTAFGLCGEDDDGEATKVPNYKRPVTKAAEPQNHPAESASEPRNEVLEAARKRLWNACKAFAEKHNADPKKISEGVLKRPDIPKGQDPQILAQWYIQVAGEFESEVAV